LILITKNTAKIRYGFVVYKLINQSACMLYPGRALGLISRFNIVRFSSETYLFVLNKL